MKPAVNRNMSWNGRPASKCHSSERLVMTQNLARLKTWHDSSIIVEGDAQPLPSHRSHPRRRLGSISNIAAYRGLLRAAHLGLLRRWFPLIPDAHLVASGRCSPGGTRRGGTRSPGGIPTRRGGTRSPGGIPGGIPGGGGGGGTRRPGSHLEPQVEPQVELGEEESQLEGHFGSPAGLLERALLSCLPLIKGTNTKNGYAN